MRRKYPGLIVKERESWDAIEAAAREQARAYLDEVQVTPSAEWGSLVAWSEAGYRGATAGVSLVHRVGPSAGRLALTLCNARLPEPQSHIALSRALVKALGKCHRCEARYAKGWAAA